MLKLDYFPSSILKTGDERRFHPIWFSIDIHAKTRKTVKETNLNSYEFRYLFKNVVHSINVTLITDQLDKSQCSLYIHTLRYESGGSVFFYFNIENSRIHSTWVSCPNVVTIVAAIARTS